MASTPTGTNTPGHEDFNNQEQHIPDLGDPGHSLPTPGPQPANTSPLTGTGIPTGTRPPGWMKIFMMLVTNFNSAFLLDCLKNNRPPGPIPDSIIKMLETQTDRLCASYPKEISIASI